MTESLRKFETNLREQYFECTERYKVKIEAKIQLKWRVKHLFTIQYKRSTKTYKTLLLNHTSEDPHELSIINNSENNIL
jgi:hypothetical protein